jgi:pre-mRNA-splicing factor CDC5/CEF1
MPRRCHTQASSRIHPFTPNPLAIPLRQNITGSETPLVGGASVTPLRTPLRDNLSINPEGHVPNMNETPRIQRLRVSASSRTLQAGFINLPKPENNFELVVPDEDDGEDDANAEVEGAEDAAQRDANIKRRKKEEERRELARRSEVIKRGFASAC